MTDLARAMWRSQDATRNEKSYFSIDSISFEQEKIMVSYSGTSLDGSIEFPSEFILSDDWKSGYDSLEEKKRQEAELKELERKRKEAEESLGAKRRMYLALKKELEG